MPLVRADLLARLDALGIAHSTHEHPPVFTVEEAERHCGHLPGVHSKNLFLKDKAGRLWLVSVPFHRRVDLKALALRLGAGKFSFGKPDLLMQVLGVIPGAVTPYAVVNDTERLVTVVLDAELMAATLVNFHPLDNAAMTAMAPAALKRFLCDSGHAPEVVDFTGLERAPS